MCKLLTGKGCDGHSLLSRHRSWLRLLIGVDVGKVVVVIVGVVARSALTTLTTALTVLAWRSVATWSTTILAISGAGSVVSVWRGSVVSVVVETVVVGVRLSTAATTVVAAAVGVAATTAIVITSRISTATRSATAIVSLEVSVGLTASILATSDDRLSIAAILTSLLQG